MQWSSTQIIMDYTTVPVGLRVEGRIWTGQATTVTALCPKCGRIGVVSVRQDDYRITVFKLPAPSVLDLFGWEAGTRTPIARFRVWSPTIGRPPSSEFEFT